METFIIGCIIVAVACCAYLVVLNVRNSATSRKRRKVEAARKGILSGASLQNTSSDIGGYIPVVIDSDSHHHCSGQSHHHCGGNDSHHSCSSHSSCGGHSCGGHGCGGD